MSAQDSVPVVVEEPQSPSRPKFAGFKRFKQLAKLKGMKETLVEASSTTTSTSDTSHDADSDDDEDPNDLAQRIRELIGSLLLSSDVPSPAPAPSPSPPRDTSGYPIPPPSAVHVKDEHLVKLLSDPTVMNGDKKEEWPTVWNVLLSLPPPSSKSKDQSESRQVAYQYLKNSSCDAMTSVMFYIPVEPTDDDKVELAKSELVHIASPEHVVMNASARKWWPFPNSNSSSKKEPSTNPFSKSSPSTPTPTPALAKKVWLPSTTKISIEATWWGYRIFLPPPVMAILSAQEIQAVKRAAMITTALTWLFAHLPVTVFPPAVQPVILVLQKIVPYISYIGTFISWSWGEIESFDQGYGVILNATWLIPVALIPSTWKVDSFPGATPIKEPCKSSEATIGSSGGNVSVAVPPPTASPIHRIHSLPTLLSSNTTQPDATQPTPNTEPAPVEDTSNVGPVVGREGDLFNAETEGGKDEEKHTVHTNLELPSGPDPVQADLIEDSPTPLDDASSHAEHIEIIETIVRAGEKQPIFKAPLSPTFGFGTKFLEALDENRAVIEALRSGGILSPVLGSVQAAESEAETDSTVPTSHGSTSAETETMKTDRSVSIASASLIERGAQITHTEGCNVADGKTVTELVSFSLSAEGKGSRGEKRSPVIAAQAMWKYVTG